MSQRDRWGIRAIWVEPSERLVATSPHFTTFPHTSTLTNLLLSPRLVAWSHYTMYDMGRSCYPGIRAGRGSRTSESTLTCTDLPKYSSNFTPEWIKTWPFIYAADRKNLVAQIQPSHIRHMYSIVQSSYRRSMESLWRSVSFDKSFTLFCLISGLR